MILIKQIGFSNALESFSERNYFCGDVFLVDENKIHKHERTYCNIFEINIYNAKRKRLPSYFFYEQDVLDKFGNKLCC